MNIFVVIVTYNGSQWLNRCLSSLFDSTLPLQVVVIDNHSTDNSLEIVSQFPAVRTFRSQENLGFGRANNTGIQYALDHGADYVFLLNQDAWVRPDTIQHLIEVNRRHPEYYVLSPLHLDGSEIRLDQNFQHYVSPENCRDLLSDLAVNRNKLKEVYEIRFVNAALWLLPRQCLLEIGGFDPLFPHYGEDNDFIKRVNYHGHKIGICPGTFGVHDRPQRNDFSDVPGQKQSSKKLETDALIKLKNVNAGLNGIESRVYLNMFKYIIGAAIRLQFSEVAKHALVLSKTTGRLKRIGRHRAISKKRGGGSIWLRNSSPVDAVELVNDRIPGKLL